MPKVNLKRFMSVNQIRQKDIADCLAVSKSFISNVANGNAGFSEESIQRLKDEGHWDIAPLFEKDSTTTREEFEKFVSEGRREAISDRNELDEIQVLKARIKELEEQLKKTEMDKERYWEMIQKLMGNGKSL